MKRNLRLLISLACGAALVGCTSDEDMSSEVQPAVSQQWNAVVHATLDSINDGNGVSDVTTRAIFYGGNTSRFAKVWDKGDQVHVYKDDAEIGILTPLAEYYATKAAVLTGTMSGDFAVGDNLKLYMPSRVADYTGQTGSLNKLSNTYSYQENTGATVADVNKDGSKLSLSEVNMSHRQEYVWFVLTDEAGTTRLHPSRLDIHAISGGHIVESIAADGTITPCDVLTVTPEADAGEYPGELFVALLNDGDNNVTFRLKATVGSDIYVGPVDIEGQSALAYSPSKYKGSLSRVDRKMRLTSPVSSLTIDPIADQAYTGSAITPTVTVKDGETVLVKDVDYSVSYSANVDAGEVTVTVTGLAMSGPKAQTKWLGEKTTTFNILPIEPTIEISTADMTLAVGANETRVVTRVFLDNNGNGTWDEGIDFDVTAQAHIGYVSDATGVATVVSSGANAGRVTGVAPGTATIRAYLINDDAVNLLDASKTYTVKVGTVGTGQSVTPWTDGDTTNEEIPY